MEVVPQLLVKKEKGVKLGDFFFFACQTMSSVFTKRQVDVLKKINLSDYKYFVGFYELDNHWRLIMAEKDTGRFYYIDPFISSTSEK